MVLHQQVAARVTIHKRSHNSPGLAFSLQWIHHYGHPLQSRCQTRTIMGPFINGASHLTRSACLFTVCAEDKDLCLCCPYATSELAINSGAAHKYNKNSKSTKFYCACWLQALTWQTLPIPAWQWDLAAPHFAHRWEQQIHLADLQLPLPETGQHSRPN